MKNVLAIIVTVALVGVAVYAIYAKYHELYGFNPPPVTPQEQTQPAEN